ncbi:MAG: helix-turn-helix domain-containing protein [Cytophagales bacterium]|nr:helix-turn-helix domain-containing protein [Cytophagales bacterium]
MLFDFLNTIILLGSLQGFIFSFLLFFNPLGRIAERLLATLLFLLSFASLNIYLSETLPHSQVGVFLSLVPTILIMPFGPLIYFYKCFILDPSYSWKHKYWLHFLPVIIDILPVIIGWILTIGFILKAFTQNYLLEWGIFIDQYNSYSDIPRWLSLSIYLVVTKKSLSQPPADYKGDGHLQRSEQFRLNQFLNVFLIFQLVWLAFLMPYIIPSSRFIVLNNLGYYPIYIPMAILIYWLGIKGYLHTRLQAKHGTESRSIRLTEKESEKLIAALKKAMEVDKLYLEPNLTLGKLVKHIDSDQRTVSHVLNQYLSRSFNAFVNYYRIEEVKHKMIAPGNKHLTLSGIAFECGFNSQSTFQRVFKQFTKLSPKEYRSRRIATK